MNHHASIAALHDAIRNMHGCDSRFVEAIYVSEMYDGRVAFEGTVNVFELVDHPQATRAYAWSYATSHRQSHFVAVLGVPPVVSAETAVRATIVAEQRAKLN